MCAQSESARFFLASDDASRGEREQRAVVRALTGTPDATAKTLAFFYTTTHDLIVKESWCSVGSNTRHVDIIRDVLRYVPIHWACEMVSSVLLFTGSV